MKQSSDCWTSKTVTATNWKDIIRKLYGKPRQTSNAIFTATGFPNGPKATRNCIVGTLASVRTPFNAPSQEFQVSECSKIHDVEHVFCSLPRQGGFLGHLTVGSMVGSISKMRFIKVYDVNTRVEVTCLGWCHWRQIYWSSYGAWNFKVIAAAYWNLLKEVLDP